MVKTCEGCRNGAGFEAPISMAFQPIVDTISGTVFAHEALVRGADEASAASVLARVTEENRYAFDQQCRVTAIEHAARLGIGQNGHSLSINFLPNAVYEPTACIRLTLATAKRTGFPLSKIIFEFTENEQVKPDHISKIITTYKAMGFKTAIDDFGAGFSGLTLLARFQPDIVKIDMDLVRGIDHDPVRRAIVRSVVGACSEIGVDVLAEGIETLGEHLQLNELGISLQQGFLFAKPAFEAMAEPEWPQAKDLLVDLVA
jgi:EAL domain-containing protein (putative c-di-GMP-specific phosphodiesterase class I)